MTAPAPQPVLRLALFAGLGALAVTAVMNAAFDLEVAWLLHWLPECVFHAATGVPCPGCGMTRALLLLTQFRWVDAVSMHPAAPLVVLGATWTACGGALPKRRIRDISSLVGVAALGLWWVGRTIGS